MLWPGFGASACAGSDPSERMRAEIENIERAFFIFYSFDGRPL
jgi:hypothetical protein